METIKSFINRDGNIKVSIYTEEYPDNPRNTTDFPLHCVDFSQDYSIMVKTDERYNEQRDFLECILGEYGDEKKIIDFLVDSGKHLNDTKCNNALIYNHKEKCWELVEYSKYYGEKEYSWKQQDNFYCSKYDIDIYILLRNVTDSTINNLLGFLTDEIKIVSFGFCYDGSMYFGNSIDTDSTGFIWLNKKEYLKYTGANEDSWKELKIAELGECKELIAWSNNEVYCFEVEKGTKFHNTKTNIETGETSESDTMEWTVIDSCGGFYGDMEYCLEYAFDGYNRDDFEEITENK